MATPSVAKLSEMLDLDREDAKLLKEALVRADGGSNQRVEEALVLADKLMEAHGIEAIRDPGNEDDAFYGDIVALYVNTGDTYTGTLLYDVDKDRFYATTYGDWLEGEERRGRYIPNADSLEEAEEERRRADAALTRLEEEGVRHDSMKYRAAQKAYQAASRKADALRAQARAQRKARRLAGYEANASRKQYDAVWAKPKGGKMLMYKQRFSSKRDAITRVRRSIREGASSGAVVAIGPHSEPHEVFVSDGFYEDQHKWYHGLFRRNPWPIDDARLVYVRYGLTRDMVPEATEDVAELHGLSQKEARDVAETAYKQLQKQKKSVDSKTLDAARKTFRGGMKRGEVATWLQDNGVDQPVAQAAAIRVAEER